MTPRAAAAVTIDPEHVDQLRAFLRGAGAATTRDGLVPPLIALAGYLAAELGMVDELHQPGGYLNND